MPPSTWGLLSNKLCADSRVTSHPNNGSTAANPRAPQPNPNDPNRPQEPTGPVASDSLAAESLKSGGAFAQNEKVEAMGVEGGKSTLNNSDTAGAKELRPAADAAHREGDQQAKHPDGAGKPQFAGMHDQHGYVGGPSPDRAGPTSGSGEYSTGQASSSTGGARHTSGEAYRANAAADPAPTIYSDYRTEENLKPKGRNITEGDIPPTETVMSNVGEANDPERLAEEKTLSRNADTSGGGAGGAKQYGVERSTGQFDVLAEESAA
jgi:hypothetical protein